MSHKTQSIKSYKIIYPQLYSYTLPNRHQNDGAQKVGYTERKNVDNRILEQVKTAAFNEEYDKLWSAPAFFKNNEESFTDSTFHTFLEKKGIERRTDLGREWFFFNGEPCKSKDLFDLFRTKGFSALQNQKDKIPYTLRFEQDEAVKKALAYFNKTGKGEFLWNAKPRFGKTLSSYHLAKRLKAKKVLIVTNRPAIANSWFDDYEKFIDGYAFISEASSLKNKPTITRDQHIAGQPILPQFTFLSLQDLKGSKYFGGNYDKLRWIAELEWDLLIIDEAHEGVDTSRTDAAFDVVKRKHTLHLSGTPFKALANEKFPNEAIYNWTYLDEQQIKTTELEEGEVGDHTDLPELKLFTYRISQMTTQEVNEGIEIDDETRDYAFDLNEFFRAQNKKFVRENEVKEFLRNLSTNKKYPFSTPKLREELKHTFWYVGNRVESVKALERLLKKDPVFKDYKIIVAAGDGRTFEEEEKDFRNNEKSFERVQKAIAENDKTITLSCGQLTTGVTVKEWTAVLMLTDIKSPSLYMQAAFRAQNPYKEMRNGELFFKKSAYLFDFAPTRVLEIYDDFANGLNPKAVQGEITEKEREENIEKLLNFFPVISEDVHGEMIKLDAEQVLTFPNALAASEIVNARFMTNLLFNDSLKGVFNFPKEVEDILDKMPEEKNKRTRKPKSKLDLDEAKKVNENKATKINENTGIILGEKIYGTNSERIIDDLLSKSQEKIDSKQLVDEISEVAAPLIAKYKEVYKATKAETKETAKQLQRKVKEIAEEYNSAAIKDPEGLKQKVTDAIEVDFIENKVTEKEEEIVEKVQKTKADEIRDRLRSFTRTIPMFIMANDSKAEITINNFDEEIDEADFEELTGITKDEFHKLRDGFDYEEGASTGSAQAGERKTFQGVFNKYRFNASIAEFRQRKEDLADYFTAEEDIFEWIPNQKTNQIFTPKKVVKMMMDQLEEHDPSLFTRTDSTFIDLYMKSGMYITEIVKKLFHNTRKHYDSDGECLKHIFENQVYGLSPTPILQGITQSFIFGFDEDKRIDRKHFVQHDLTPEAEEGNAKEKLQELFNLKEDMKFDAVVGNPPYQINDGGGTGSSAIPIYHKYVQQAKKLNPNYLSMIIPARWFTGGRGLDKFRAEMLKEKRITELHDFPNASDCFSGVEIKGGVLYFLWEKDYNGKTKVFTHSAGKIISKSERFLLEKDAETFVRNNEVISILHKVQKLKEKSFADIISANDPFGFDVRVEGSYKRVKPQYKKEIFKDAAKFYYNGWQRKGLGYIKEGNIRKNIEMINGYKVLITKAWGVGDMSRDWLQPILVEPKACCTETYLVIGPFDSKKKTENVIAYTQTKIFHLLVSLIKITQNAMKKVYSFVPLQDFTENSDIDWSKSIPEIDQQLYKKYNLSEEEIAFIEEKVQPMD